MAGLLSPERIDQQERIRAAVLGQPAWGTVGDAENHRRYVEPVPEMRRGCPFCDGARRATHAGRCNGLTMTFGCEWHVRKWVRDGWA